MLKTGYLVVAMSAIFCLGMAAQAQSGKPVVGDLVTLFSAWSGYRIDPYLSEEAARKIDYQGMAKAALGPGAWDSLSANEKREFVTTFRRLIEERYYARWHKLFYRGSLSYLSEENSRGGDMLVKTRLSVGKKSDIVMWRLHPHNGELMVSNLYIGDKDLLGHLNARFQKLLARKGTRGLIAWMKDKIDDEEPVQRASSRIVPAHE